MKDQDEKMEKSRFELNFSTRKERLVLVASVMGILFFVFSNLRKFFDPFFKTYYIDQFPLNTSHIVVTVFLGSAIILFGYLLFYAYHEYNTFAIYEDENELQKHIDRANQSYVRVLKVTKYCIYFSLGSVYVFMCVFDYRLLIITVGPLLTGVILGLCLRNSKVAKMTISSKIKAPPIISKIISMAAKLPGPFIFFWLLACLLIFIVGGQFFQPAGKLELQYKTIPVSIEMTFTEKVPKQVEVFILRGKGDNDPKEVIFEEKDFQIAFSELITNSLDNDNFVESLFKKEQGHEIQLDKSHYVYKKTVDLSGLLKEGVNYTVIQFKDDNGIKEQKYKVVNQIEMKSGVVTFTSDKTEIKF